MKDEDKTKEQLLSEIKELRQHISETDKSESERLVDIIDFLPDATFAIDLSRKVIAWNRAMEEITGVKAEDILGKADYEYSMVFYGTRRLLLVDLVFGLDEETEKKYDFIKKKGDVLLAETDLIVNGIHRVIWVKAGPLYDKNDHVMGAIESVRDITDRRRMEKALQEAHDELEIRVRERTAELIETNEALEKEIAEHKHSEELLRESMLFNKEIIDSASEGIIVYDRFFNYLVWNSFMEKTTGKSADEVLGKNAFSLFPHLLEQGIDILMRKALSGEVINTPDTRFYIPEKGLFCWVSSKYGPHRNEKGEIIGVIAIVSDISERKQAETIRKESEEKFSVTFYKSPIPLAITSMKDGRYIDVNESFMKVMGLNYEELVGNSSTGAGYISMESRKLFLEEFNQKGIVENLELPMRVKGGELRYGLFNTSKITIDGEDFFLTMVTDITELRRIEEELRRYREKLENMVEERTCELEEKTKSLLETNTALNVLLQKREEDRKVLEERFITNIGRLVVPYIEKIGKSNLDDQQQLCLQTIKQHLEDIISPLLKNMEQYNLTPREVQLSTLIKDGRTSAEIADIMGIAKGSIDTHRKNIRKKLGMNRSSNLQSRLRFLEQ